MHLPNWFSKKTFYRFLRFFFEWQKGFDKGLMTGMILIDLQKAFSIIDHDSCKNYMLLVSQNML